MRSVERGINSLCRVCHQALTAAVIGPPVDVHGKTRGVGVLELVVDPIPTKKNTRASKLVVRQIRQIRQGTRGHVFSTGRPPGPLVYRVPSKICWRVSKSPLRCRGEVPIQKTANLHVLVRTISQRRIDGDDVESIRYRQVVVKPARRGIHPQINPVNTVRRVEPDSPGGRPCRHGDYRTAVPDKVPRTRTSRRHRQSGRSRRIVGTHVHNPSTGDRARSRVVRLLAVLHRRIVRNTNLVIIRSLVCRSRNRICSQIDSVQLLSVDVVQITTRRNSHVESVRNRSSYHLNAEKRAVRPPPNTVAVLHVLMLIKQRQRLPAEIIQRGPMRIRRSDHTSTRVVPVKMVLRAQTRHFLVVQVVNGDGLRHRESPNKRQHRHGDKNDNVLARTIQKRVGTVNRNRNRNPRPI